MHVLPRNPQLKAASYHEKTQPGGTGDRKSLGKTPAAPPANTITANKKSPEKDHPGKAAEVIPDLSIVSESEPTLKDVLCAVNSCRSSLSNLCDQLRGLKEELCSMSQELQKVGVRTSMLEDRLSQAKDILHPLRQEFKLMKAQLDIIS